MGGKLRAPTSGAASGGAEETPAAGQASESPEMGSALFVLFDPNVSGERREVRSAAARASAHRRRATLALRRPVADRERSVGVRSDATRGRAAGRRRSDAGQQAGRDRDTRPQWLSSSSAGPSSGSSSASSSSTSSPDEEPWRAGIHPPWDSSLALEADRLQLYKEVVNSPALWQSTFLWMRTWHAIKAGLIVRKEYRASMLFLKSEALRVLRETVASTHSIGPVAGAIALLAGWEARNGDADAFDVHARAWRRLMASRGLNVQSLNVTSHLISLSDRVVETVNQRCADVVPWREQPFYALLPSRMSPLFSVFLPYERSTVALFNNVDQLARFDPTSSDSLARLREMSYRTILWEEPENVSEPARIFSLRHISTAVKALMGRLLGHPHITARLEVPWPMESSLLVVRNIGNAMGLQDFEIVLGTKYEIVSFWAFWLWSTACSWWNDHSLAILKRYLQSLKLRKLAQITNLLTQFAWREDQLGASSKALFRAVSSFPRA